MNSRIPLQNGSEVISLSRGSYVILRLLSDSGGSALTYHAVRRSDGQLVVLKELYPLSFATLLRDKTGRTQPLTSEQQKMMTQRIDAFSAEAAKNHLLQKEFGALVAPDSDAKLAPDYAFSSSDAFEATNGMWYIEICTGQGECLNKKNLSITACIDDILKLCKVVEKLHSLGDGYLHLDLKPDNIFITSSEELKLLDFGSMLPIREPHQEHLSYSSGFSAPELYYEYQTLFQEETRPSTYSDCYSVAAIFYWQLFGDALAEEKMLYTSEINLRLLDRDEFPKLLRGYSYKTLNLALSILRKGLSFYPENRYQTMIELRADLQKLLEECQKDDEDISPVTNANGFIKRIANIDDFLRNLPLKCVDCVVESKKPGNYRGCCLVCELLHAYMAKHLENGFSEIKQKSIPEACITSVETRFLFPGDYRLALFCFRILHKKTEKIGAKWNRDSRHRLFSRIRNLASNFNDESLLAEYPEGTGVKYRGDMHERRMDFDGMVKNIEGYLCYKYGTKFIHEIVLEEDDIDEKLAECAGQLVEALCLQRAQGWEQKAHDILNYVLLHMPTEQHDNSFRDRSVNNMLWFAVETNNSPLFVETLGLLPPNHRLYLDRNKDVGDWICELASSFPKAFIDTYIIDDAYWLYLYLKSLNVLFIDEAKQSTNCLKEILNAILNNGRKIKLFSVHPGELILKHMALLSKSVAGPTKEIITLLEEFSKNEHRKNISIVSLIADAALLSLGDKDGTRLKQLREDIAAGVEQKVFCKEYFEDILTEKVSSEELLAKFRFKHA